MYVIPLLYRVSSTAVTTKNPISVIRIHQALQAVVTKHKILRTALYLDTNSTVLQRCLDATDINYHSKPYGFSVINLARNDRPMNEIVIELLNQFDLFDLSKGRVINCHILRQYRSHQLPSDTKDLLTNNDLILFTIHHTVFDGASVSVFNTDFCRFYENNGSSSINDNTLQYIDYSVHERVMNMTSSHEFWRSELVGYNLEHPLTLPTDRHRVASDEHYSGLSYTAKINFDDKITISFLNYASSNNLTPFQLGLATFYAFLFKLSQGQHDLCIASINANRYRSELQDLIGMFVATLPHRIQLDSHWSFDKLVKHVRDKCLSILEYSNYPLQQILADFRLNQSNVPFLETMFDFITEFSNDNHFSLNDANLELVPIEQSDAVAKFDFTLTFNYNPTVENNKLSCSFVCSRDLYEEKTVITTARRFQYIFGQLFQTMSSTVLMDESATSIKKLSVILSEEAEELQEVTFDRLQNIVNEGM
jgi:hypothetical protein